MLDIIKSWAGVGNACHSIRDILDWVEEKNNNLCVTIKQNSLEDSTFWFYNKENGMIQNKNNSFFQIAGLKVMNGDEIVEQPIIIQDEIGYLGIICKKINDTLHFLMQAKIEPGNINKIQISPTIQATKSNFTQKHGGNKPAYLDYFIEAEKHKIIVDQIQSEQSSRFLKKRNRNIIILVEDELEILPSHKWMTLKQIKELMRIDNLVNMDTRTVLSCIPYSISNLPISETSTFFNDRFLCSSIFNNDPIDFSFFHYMNNFKMFNESKNLITPLFELKEWAMKNNEFVCQKPYNFKVIFCDISIEGREVKRWTQPLFKATGIATFGLLMANIDGKKQFLVKLKPEFGCYDKLELGPSIQEEAIEDLEYNEIDKLFFVKYEKKQNVLYDVILSEEGGRFYHEQNKNIIIEINPREIVSLPDNYFWLDYKTLNYLIQFNNVLNIQLRNLLSLLEV